MSLSDLISNSTFKRAIDVFDIKACVIPNRKILKEKNGQWIG